MRLEGPIGVRTLIGPERRLELSVPQERDQSTDELPIRRRRRIPIGDVELLLRRLDRLPQDGAREVDAAVTLEQPEHPLHVAFHTLFAPHREDLAESLPLIGGALTQGVNEHQCALAFADVPEDLLAVSGLVADQVEDVVLDLKTAPSRKPNRLNRSASIAPPVAISAPIRHGWIAVYQQVFFRTIRR